MKAERPGAPDATIDMATDNQKRKDEARREARCFYKRFDTPTRCHGNDDKHGVQIQIAVGVMAEWMSMELDLCAGLKDETWLKI